MGQIPAGWHPDPFRRHELRYWDGVQWTPHVSSRGLQGTDPPVSSTPVPPQATGQSPPGWYPDQSGRGGLRYWDGTQWTPHAANTPQQITSHVGTPSTPTVSQGSKKVQRQVRRAGVDADSQVGGGTLWTEPVLVVNQKAKLIEVNADYAVFNQNGQQIGAVREVGQSMMKNAISPLPSSNKTKRLQILDHTGRAIITLTRPATIARSTVIVRYTNGTEIGQIAQKNLGIIGKVRFDLQSRGQHLGSINAEGWNVWDFSIQDATGDEVARITKSGIGLSKQSSTKRDKYVVQIHRTLEDPLRSLVIAAALAVDTALRQHR